MRECQLDCMFQEEGLCTLENVYHIKPDCCKAKSDRDLVDW